MWHWLCPVPSLLCSHGHLGAAVLASPHCKQKHGDGSFSFLQLLPHSITTLSSYNNPESFSKCLKTALTRKKECCLSECWQQVNKDKSDVLTSQKVHRHSWTEKKKICQLRSKDTWIAWVSHYHVNLHQMTDLARQTQKKKLWHLRALLVSWDHRTTVAHFKGARWVRLVFVQDLRHSCAVSHLNAYLR